MVLLIGKPKIRYTRLVIEINNKISKFGEKSLYRCPLCQKAIIFRHNGSFVCVNGHSFDVSSKGYVNFIPHQKPLLGYDNVFFENRSIFMQKGFYNHIADEILRYLHIYEKIGTVVDSGCGEGYFSRLVSDKTNAQVVAFDISKEAIKIASRGGNMTQWLVADIGNIPLLDHSCDCLLNIFTPAKYDEFRRILKDDGILIKVVPSSNHLKELRQLIMHQLANKAYSNQQVIDYFSNNFSLIERKLVTKSFDIEIIELEQLINMTPLMFDINTKELNLDGIKSITIEAEILIGKNTL